MLNGSFTFYKAIRAKPICIGCHSAIRRSTATGPAIVVGDLIGVVKIEIVN